MTNTVTLSISLGSGEKAQELALKLKAWAGMKPVSQAIRELLEKELTKGAKS